MKMLANTLEHISMGKEEGSSRKVFHIISAQIKSWDWFCKTGSHEELCATFYNKVLKPSLK